MFRFWKIVFLLSVMVLTTQGQPDGDIEEDEFLGDGDESIGEVDGMEEGDEMQQEHMGDDGMEEGDDMQHEHMGDDDVMEEEGDQHNEPVPTLSATDLLNIVDMLDKNYDSGLSVEELRNFINNMTNRDHANGLESFFNHTDANQDGFLDLEEYVHAEEVDLPDEESRQKHENYLQHLRETFKSADKDGDGKLGKTEARLALRPHLDPEVRATAAKYEMTLTDENKDGELTVEEFVHHVGDHEHEDTNQQARQAFKRLDKDGNGKLNLEEFAAWDRDYHEMQYAIDWLFEKADRDHDGVVTDEELVSVHDHSDFHDSRAHSYFQVLVADHGNRTPGNHTHRDEGEL